MARASYRSVLSLCLANKRVSKIAKSLVTTPKTVRRIHETMNICVELESNSNPTMKKEGWFKTSKADWFAFYSPAVEATFFIKREELIALYKQNKNKLKHIYRD